MKNKTTAKKNTAPRVAIPKQKPDPLAPKIEIKARRDWADFEDDEAILEEAKRIFAANLSGDSDNRDEAKDDVDFLEDPWTVEARAMRTGKACLNADPLSQFRFRVKTEFARLEPSVKVRPFDSFADPKLASYLAGVVRHVEDRSRAKRVYCHAQSQMVDTGEGYYRVHYDYSNEESFEKDIFIKRIQNRFCVVPGRFQEPDGSDMFTCFVTESVPAADYEDTEAAGADWDAADDELQPWHDGEGCITIAEYWRKITKDDTLCLMSNGMKMFKSVLDDPEAKARLREANDQRRRKRLPAIRVIRTRPVKRPFVQCFKLTAFDVLSRHEWPGRWIPIVPMVGNEMVRTDGTVIRYGMVRYSKDQVRMVNYMWSEETEMVALQPRNPIVGTQEQFEGKEDQWDAAADGRSARVTYNPHVLDTPTGSVLVPPPQRQPAPVIPAAMIQSRIGAMELLRSANGMVTPDLQDQSRFSGKAVLAQKAQSDSATFQYIDGPEISIQHGARIIIDLARKIYDGPTVRRIIGDDGTEEMITFNSPVEGPDGEEQLFDLSVGEFDVTVEMGPAYATQRQEALASLTEVMGSLPPDRAAMIADLVVSNVDAKDMDKAAARLKAMLPPEVLRAEGEELGSEKPEDEAARLQQQVETMTQQIEAMKTIGEELGKELEKAKKQADDKKMAAELDYKKALLDAEVKLSIADKETERALLIERMRKTAKPEPKKPAKAAPKKPKSEANSGNG